MTPNLSTSTSLSSPKLVGCALQPFPDVPDLVVNVNDKPSGGERRCVASQKSIRTVNPIRAIVDPIVANGVKSGEERGDGKDHVSLALGDPTVGSTLPFCTVAVEALMRSVQSAGHAAGYVNACGTPEARAAIAKTNKVSPDQVIVANGCSGALELALTALLDSDSVLLVPKPGFPLYQVIAESHGATVAQYNLHPTRNWECDLDHMETLITDKVRAIVINNPSNPTGSVYSRQHLQSILRLAERHRLPVVADEVYGDLTFGGKPFISMAQVMREMGRRVPVIVASGLGKQYLLPGWRVGWVVFHDSYNQALQPVLDGAKRLSQVILGASHLAQSVVPALLDPSKDDKDRLMEWKSNLRQTLESQASLLCSELSKCRGLTVLQPEGAMYAMVQIDLLQFSGIASDVEFTKLLLEEENVFCLPGKAFGVEASFRVVFCGSPQLLWEASRRIFEFCQRHAGQENRLLARACSAH